MLTHGRFGTGQSVTRFMLGCQRQGAGYAAIEWSAVAAGGSISAIGRVLSAGR